MKIQLPLGKLGNGIEESNSWGDTRRTIDLEVQVNAAAYVIMKKKFDFHLDFSTLKEREKRKLKGGKGKPRWGTRRRDGGRGRWRWSA